VPGPKKPPAALGVDRLRLSLDLPVQVPAFARALPGPLLLPVFASLIPRMIVPYEDAAGLMLANLDRGNAMSRHRVGLALPVGMRGRKSQWSAKVNPTANPLSSAPNSLDVPARWRREQTVAVSGVRVRERRV
jgi:hypothetical protein